MDGTDWLLDGQVAQREGFTLAEIVELPDG